MNQYRIAAAFISFSALLTTGCLHEETNVEQAQYEFVHQTLTVLDRAKVILTNVSDDINSSGLTGSSSAETSTITNMSYRTLFKSNTTDKNKAEAISKLSHLVDWRSGIDALLEKAGVITPGLNIKDRIQVKILHETNTTQSDGHFNIIEDDVNKGFDKVFNPPLINGNVLTYTVKTELCDDAVTAIERVNCIDVLQRLEVVFTVDTENSGSFDLKVDGVTPLSYSYSETRLQLDIDFGAVKQSAESFSEILDMNDDANLFPETFSGKMGVYVELVSNNAVEVGLTIPESINISGDLDGSAVNFTLDASDKVIALTANQANSTIDIELGLGTMVAMFTDEMDDIFKINVPAFTGILSLNTIQESATLTNFGIGTSPMTVDINDERALELSLAKLDLTLDGDTKTMTLNSDLDFSMSVNNINSSMSEIFDSVGIVDSMDASLSGTLDVTASSGLALVNVSATDSANDVTKVDAGGPLALSGSGAFLINETVDSGECFIWEDDTAGFGSGFESGECSTWADSSGL